MAKKQENSEQEQIGFHKGALATLSKEREEMQKILSVVEQLMQMHIKALKELGVDLEKMAKDVKKEDETKNGSKSKKSAGSMDDLLG